MRGFTLLELLAVIAVIAVLAGVVIGAGQRAAASGKVARAKAELAALALALESYKATHGDYPHTAEAADLLQALIGRRAPDLSPAAGRSFLEGAGVRTSHDPWTDGAAVLIDPWDQAYRYAYRSETAWTNPSFVLMSAGPDQADTPMLRAGGFPDPAAPGNADNLYANAPR